MKVLPKVEKVSSNLLTVEVYEKIKDRPYSFFLDSGVNPLGLGRYSFLGADPFLVFKSKANRCEIETEEFREFTPGNPFTILKTLLARYSLPKAPHLPPFLGGAVGYFGYDLGELLEVLPSTTEDDLSVPDCILGFYDKVLIYDHQEETWLVSSTGLPAQDEGARETKALLRLEEAMELLLSPAIPPLSLVGGTKEFNLAPNFTPEGYCQAVQKARDYIAAGDIFQVNLSQRFSAHLPTEPFELYKTLRTINPAPFASFLNYPEVVIASTSPERFLLLHDNLVETRPIKGTRPRGYDEASDRANREELLNSTKDRAELVMIIDLERNDLGRVCTTGSIRVPDLIRLEGYATVFHLVSTVEGTLPPEKNIVDLLEASFPGGSITGAPKIRAMEIIDELEPVKRGIYTGSIGYISFNGDADLNIVIRTYVIKDDKVYYQVGGGIVADSDPQAEYLETLTKGKALRAALEQFMEKE
ncbi:MAG: aminodeoxychorismate synthase component I [Thermincolia bacterium]